MQAGGANFRNEAQFPGWRGHVCWLDRARSALKWLHETFPGLEAVVKAHPFERFESIATAGRRSSYVFVPTDLVVLMRRIPLAFHPPYLCTLLLWQMDRFDERFAATGLDPEFALHYADSFNRIVDQITANPEFASLSRDAFLKDLWIARVVMIPALAQVWWPRSGLPLRQLAHAGAGALAYCFFHCGGRKPFLEAHTHDPMVAQGFWNVAGWTEALRLAALALRAFARHKGAFSTAWYFDPVAAEISPRIRFVSELQVGHGAYRFCVGPDESATANATAKSMTRRRLYADGKYRPTDYCVAWARADLIAAYGHPICEPQLLGK